jgi:hypothetical protein
MLSSYVGETYLAPLSRRELAALEQRLRRAATHVSRNGTAVEHVNSIHLPGDETCLHLFRAVSAEAVVDAGRHAGVFFDRIAKALA